MAGNDHISVATYFRFIGIAALQGIADKVLYLDSDICVIDNKLTDFWKQDLKIKRQLSSANQMEIQLKKDYMYNKRLMLV